MLEEILAFSVEYMQGSTVCDLVNDDTKHKHTNVSFHSEAADAGIRWVSCWAPVIDLAVSCFDLLPRAASVNPQEVNEYQRRTANLSQNPTHKTAQLAP